ncbi:MAG: hypothetical protein KHX42_11915 [Prevotella sp.]|nr:hypothetical protein [Prevotella sp.]
MNKFIISCSAIFITILFASCSSTQKITVNGKPNTSIYNTEYEYLGKIQSDGKTKIKLKKKKYEALLLSQEEGSDIFIPFAINYKYTNYSTNTYLLSCIPPFLIIGTSYMYSIPDIRFGYNFKYTSNQSTNQDIPFTNYLNSGERRETAEKNSTTVISNESSNDKVTKHVVSSEAKSRTSKANKTLKNTGKTLQSVYIGNGKLIKDKQTVESYTDMKIILTAGDNNTVNVEVLESNGESFFSTASRYDIKKRGKGFYLSLHGIPSAMITIDSNNNLIYYHPKVNIDGDIYTLQINAVR